MHGFSNAKTCYHNRSWFCQAVSIVKPIAIIPLASSILQTDKAFGITTSLKCTTCACSCMVIGGAYMSAMLPRVSWTTPYSSFVVNSLSNLCFPTGPCLCCMIYMIPHLQSCIRRAEVWCACVVHSNALPHVMMKGTFLL